MKIALVHDWLTGMRGGEKCLELFCHIFPKADLYTLIHDRGNLSPSIDQMNIKTSLLDKIPIVKRYYRFFLPLMPFFIRRFDLTDYDIVLSSSHCVAKGVRVSKNALHICYCFTPMRYIWDQYDQYFNFKKSGVLVLFSMVLLRPCLQWWDVKTSEGVSHFIAISHHVRKRIEKYYGRHADVIYPPVDTKFFSPTGEVPSDFYLIVSAFAPYKRIEIAVEAFNKLGYPLKIIGDGQESRLLKKIAFSNIEFLGWCSDEAIRSYYARCRAFIFPGEEDFGITPLEAQSMGRPVVACGRGGALEAVIPELNSWKPEYNIPLEKTCRPTGVLFHEATSDALVKAIYLFESVESSFDSRYIRQHAIKFDREVFAKKFRGFLSDQAIIC